jgi:PilZ domain-containing protein
VKTKMRGRRRSARRTKRLQGRLYFQVDDRRSSLPCLVRDMSYEGARIVVAGRSKIPDELDLYIPERKRIAHASVRWRHGARVGLVLSNVTRARG